MTNTDKIERARQQLTGLDQLLSDISDRILLNDSNSGIESDKILQSLAVFLALQSDARQSELLNKILRCARYVVGAGGAGLTLFDHSKQKLVFTAAIGDGSEGIIGYEVPLKGSQHGLAFATGEVQSSTPLHSDAEKAAQATFRNVLVAPLLVDEEPIGTMSAVNKQASDHFTPQDMEAYQLFADLAAQIVHQHQRSQLFQQHLQKQDLQEQPSLAPLSLSEEDQLILRCVQQLVTIKNTKADLLSLCSSIITQIAQA